MTRLLTGLAAATVLALSAASAQADCSGHNVTASSEQAKDNVAMSTYDGASSPAPLEEAKDSPAAADPVCAEGEKDCGVETK